MLLDIYYNMWTVRATKQPTKSKYVFVNGTFPCPCPWQKGGSARRQILFRVNSKGKLTVVTLLKQVDFSYDTCTFH